MKFQQVDKAMEFLADPEVPEIILQYEYEQDVRLIYNYLQENHNIIGRKSMKNLATPHGRIRLVGVRDEPKARGMLGIPFFIERLSETYEYGDTLWCFIK